MPGLTGKFTAGEGQNRCSRRDDDRQTGFHQRAAGKGQANVGIVEVEDFLGALAARPADDVTRPMGAEFVLPMADLMIVALEQGLHRGRERFVSVGTQLARQTRFPLGGRIGTAVTGMKPPESGRFSQRIP